MYAAVMETRLRLDILAQPDDFTCGPTALHAVYRYFGDEITLEQVIAETGRLEEGGTLAAFLACHALRRGYRATIYSYNLQLFDPTWFTLGDHDIVRRLHAQAAAKPDPKLQVATAAYVEFLQHGGELRLEDLTTRLIRRYLKRSVPLLTGLSASYLYRCAREWGPTLESDDIRGEPTGHFVVLCGYDAKTRNVLVADPHSPNPVSASRQYEVNIDRVLCAILLGIVTYDANLLVVRPPKSVARARDADPDRGQQPG